MAIFSLRSFIKNGFLKAVGNLPDHRIILNAAGYFDKGVLTEEDLADIQSAIDAKNAPPPAPFSPPDSDTDTDAATQD